MVRQYWAVQDQENRNTILSRHNAYHGSTIEGASLGDMQAMHTQGGLLIANIEHIGQPYYYREGR